jgi:hypothetical protein
LSGIIISSLSELLLLGIYCPFELELKKFLIILSVDKGNFSGEGGGEENKFLNLVGDLFGNDFSLLRIGPSLRTLYK